MSTGDRRIHPPPLPVIANCTRVGRGSEITQMIWFSNADGKPPGLKQLADNMPSIEDEPEAQMAAGKSVYHWLRTDSSRFFYYPRFGRSESHAALNADE